MLKYNRKHIKIIIQGEFPTLIIQWQCRIMFNSHTENGLMSKFYLLEVYNRYRTYIIKMELNKNVYG